MKKFEEDLFEGPKDKPNPDYTKGYKFGLEVGIKEGREQVLKELRDLIGVDKAE